ncbi:hypothetical protein HPG69_001041 [Diceros bicornis minor]|uniref:Uncharacterized protein n=1 Tax=Diceros bicornis minor TaxID=77932 RepID=A0A7J7E6P6_DICBM|nr:hypothetical protein HPG69_001041 [Diceros bicornis minor]
MAVCKIVLIWDHETSWNLENCFSCRDNTDVSLVGHEEVKYEMLAMIASGEQPYEGLTGVNQERIVAKDGEVQESS